MWNAAVAPFGAGKSGGGAGEGLEVASLLYV
jgi:hypothetical protein